ncbi:MAG: bifunctional precorrin-2 dehydrogenase/sirohydrochlorin ferrochelatase [Clostridiaceae bacterium]|jgi:siroheme synthase-like protein|nr:bifunctional precorrin-2 dehydrogenase/sirohydrochlorin ferrochelatase [Clostridiaceae bacterium]
MKECVEPPFPQKDRFPLFCDIRGKKALVAGGGAVAARRCRTLCRFSFEILAVAPQLDPSILALERQGLLKTARRPFEPRDLEGAFVAVAATDSRETNRQIGLLAWRAGCFVSVADRAEECTFFFPALVETETLTIGVAGDGRDHAAVARAAGQIREVIG